MQPVIISFYTPNWRYRQYAEKLAQQLDAMDIKHDIQLFYDRGDWLANTRLKPLFIRDMLNFYPSIVWIDADSTLHMRPHMLLNFTEDLLLRPHATVQDRLWHVSVMGIKSTPETRALCDEWIKRANEVGGTDESAFDDVIRNHPGLNIGLLPPKYHRLQHEQMTDAVISIGVSKDDDKMRIKKRGGFR